MCLDILFWQTPEKFQNYSTIGIFVLEQFRKHFNDTRSIDVFANSQRANFLPNLNLCMLPTYCCFDGVQLHLWRV